MRKIQIVKATARQILDSRGNPTVEATVTLSDGTVGIAGVPSGASTGSYEAHELRDKDASHYGGKAVTQAVYNVNKLISPAITGISAFEQYEIDSTMMKLDGTKNKSRLGANAILGVSLAAARAAANSLEIPLFRYIGGIGTTRLPIPMMNILNGGAHAANNLDIQEFMILPVGAESFAEAMEIGSGVYHALGRLLREKGYATTVGDEGGFAPDLSGAEEAIELILAAIRKAGHDENTVKLALDAAASEWQTGEGYKLPKAQTEYTGEGLISYWKELCAAYPIVSIEDGLSENDFKHWRVLNQEIGDRVMLVGDDLFVTNTERLIEGARQNAGNAILIKPNQIGTLSETLDVIALAAHTGYEFIVSHRSGETDDTTIADLAIGTSAGFIKTGAPCRSERVAKYNRLLKIEAALGGASVYG